MAEQRKVILVEDFPNFVYLEMPSSLFKPMRESITRFFEENDIELTSGEWTIKKFPKYFFYSKTTYPFLIIFYHNPNACLETIKKISQGFEKLLFKETKQKIKFKVKTFFDSFSLSQKFSAITKLNPGHWIRIKEKLKIIELDEWQVEKISYKELSKENPPSTEIYPKIKIACLDFEVYSSRKNKFPDPWEPLDEIYLASLVVGTIGVAGSKKGYLLTSKSLPFKTISDSSEEGESEIIYAKDELDLLKKLERLIDDLDLDFLMTFNGSSFDFPYWKARIDSGGEKLGNFGRIPIKNPMFKDIDWSSSAHKARSQKTLIIPGVSVIDLYTILRRDTFHPIYTLDYLSEQILGSDAKKDHLPAEEQFRIYREGTLDEWHKLLHYSLRDSFAPVKMVEKLKTINNLFAMAAIIGINIEDVYIRGQQYRLENRIFQHLIENNVALDPPPVKNFSKFKGAIVQEPVIGLFTNVAVIDFASLYPTTIIAFNISHDTFVGTNLSRPPKGLLWEDLNEIKIDEGKIHYFVKKHVKIGTIPSLLTDFLASRNAKKALMKKEKDPVIYANLDGEQNALKVIANSSYGLLGASNGKLPLPEAAESVTAKGRDLITFVKNCLEEIGAFVLAGDTDSIFFTFKKWKKLDGPEAMGVISSEVKKIAKDITERISLPPIEIVLDHLYADYMCLQKKHDVKNEVVFDGDKCFLKTKYKGIIIVRREHCPATKKIYAEVAIAAIGRTSWGEKDSLAARKKRCEEILFNGASETKEVLITETLPVSKVFPEMGSIELTRVKEKRLGGLLGLMSRSTPFDDLSKITQASREAKDYKLPSQPIRRFLEREEREGRPIKVGERFSFWRIRPSKEILEASKKDKSIKIYAGDWMRKKLEDGEKIDTLFYVKSLKTPITKVFKACFDDEKFFKEIYNSILLKETLLGEIENGKISIKKKKYTRI